MFRKLFTKEEEKYFKMKNSLRRHRGGNLYLNLCWFYAHVPIKQRRDSRESGSKVLVVLDSFMYNQIKI